MNDKEMEDAVEILKNGSPREVYNLEKQMINLSASNVIRLSELLNSCSENDTLIAILNMLGNSKIDCPSVIDLVIMKLRSKNVRIRTAAALALLHSSPGLKNRIRELNDISLKEKDEGIKKLIMNILKRYKDIA